VRRPFLKSKRADVHLGGAAPDNHQLFERCARVLSTIGSILPGRRRAESKGIAYTPAPADIAQWYGSCFVSLWPSAQCYERGGSIQTGTLISYSIRGVVPQDRGYGPIRVRADPKHSKSCHVPIVRSILPARKVVLSSSGFQLTEGSGNVRH
jgi:hypothetical protein